MTAIKAKLTEARRRLLGTKPDKHGVFTLPYATGFARVSLKRNADWLVAQKFIMPYLHGGYILTDTGRAALVEF